MGQIDGQAVGEIDHRRGKLPAGQQGPELQAGRRIEEGVDQGPDGLDDTAVASLFKEPEASGRIAERPRHVDRVAGFGPAPSDGRFRLPRHRDRDHDPVGLGEVASDQGDSGLAGRGPEPGHELTQPALLDVPGKGHPHEGMEGPSAHGGDVAEVDVEGLTAEEPGRMPVAAKILVLDEDVGRQKELSGRLDQGRIVADAD